MRIEWFISESGYNRCGLEAMGGKPMEEENLWLRFLRSFLYNQSYLKQKSFKILTRFSWPSWGASAIKYAELPQFQIVSVEFVFNISETQLEITSYSEKQNKLAFLLIRKALDFSVAVEQGLAVFLCSIFNPNSWSVFLYNQNGISKKQFVLLVKPLHSKSLGSLSSLAFVFSYYFFHMFI